MNVNLSKTIRLGALLTLLVALLAFAFRTSQAQTAPSQPLRLSLGDAARLAARQTAGVESALERVKAAEARVQEKRADLLTNVTGLAAATQTTINSATFGFNFPAPAGQEPLLNPDGQIIGPIRLLDFRGRVSQPIYDFAAVQRIRAARGAVGAAGADVAGVAEQAADNAAAVYLRALRTDAQLRARLADSTLAAELVGIARDQLTAGVGVALDVTRAQSQLASMRAQLIAARNDRERSRVDLRRALNLPIDAPLELTDSLAAMPELAQVDEQAAVERALANRPDVKAINQQIRVAELQTAAIRAERLPTVSVVGDNGMIGKGPEHLLDTYHVGLEVSVPIFDGSRRDARAREQTAAVRDIEVRRRDLNQQVIADVRAATLDLTSASQQVDAQRTRLNLAELELAEARDRFRAGVAGNADVVTASLSLNGARTLLIDALTALQAGRVALARAEGAVTELR